MLGNSGSLIFFNLWDTTFLSWGSNTGSSMFTSGTQEVLRVVKFHPPYPWDLLGTVAFDEKKGAEVRDHLVIAPKVQHPGLISGVAVLPVRKGKTVPLQAYRHAVGDHVWEVPRGFGDRREDGWLRDRGGDYPGDGLPLRADLRSVPARPRERRQFGGLMMVGSSDMSSKGMKETGMSMLKSRNVAAGHPSP